VERRVEILRVFRQLVEEIKGKFIDAEHYNSPGRDDENTEDRNMIRIVFLFRELG
jgi:hypothetical protein